MFKKKKVEKQEELPKAMLKMQQEKQEREEGNEKPVEMENIKRPKSKHNKANNKKITVKRIIIILIVIICIIVAIMLGISCYKWKTMAKDMFTNKNSIVVDTDGKQIAELGSERKKIKVDSDKMPEKLKDAYVSIEDERFYKHHGVDIKRTTSAIFSYVFHAGNSSYGGSTITQQLVKNITGDNTDSVTRKIKEWWKAYQLEWYFSKDDILDMYLNVIYVGPNIYGVGAGSEYYFNKDVQKLSIAESAFLAGINNSPNSYNPFEK